MIRTYLIAWGVLALIVCASALGAEEDASGHAVCAEQGYVLPLTITLPDAPDAQLRALRADYFLDHTGLIGPANITQQRFRPNRCSSVFKAPVPSQALWLRFSLASSLETQGVWVISFIEEIFDEVALFEEREGTLVALTRAGRTIPPEAKNSTAIRTGLAVTMPSGDHRMFYLRINGTFEPTINAVIMSEELFSDWATVTLLMSALFLAYVVTFAVLSVVVFRQIDRRFYQYYALYMLCLFMFTSIYDGWLNQLFGATLPATTITPVTEGFAGLGTLANVQYCRVLLRVDADARIWRRLFQVLSVVIVGVTGMAMLDPWHLAMPLHLIYVVSPLVLLVVAVRKVRAGLPQAWPVAGSLLALSGGLFVAVYSFLVPVSITEADSAFDLVLARPLSLGYIAAIVGETLFMLLAISTMVRAMQSERRSAVVELAALGRRVKDIEQQQGKVEKTTKARLEALEAALADDPEGKRHLSMRHQFLDRVTENILDNISDQSFGVEKLADVLAVSQKTLGRRLKQANGQSPASFIRSVRLNFARNLILLDQYKTVAEVAHAAGFSSVSNFAKLYKQQFNETPRQSIGTLRGIQ